QASAGISRGGTGLGLAITRQHVELMGGRLRLESAPGEGSRFSFVLWLPEGEESKAESSQPGEDRLEPPGLVRAVSDLEIPIEVGEIEEVPEELRLQLIAAAEMCSITDLKECVLQLETSNFAVPALVNKLKRCIRQYDLASVQRLLGCEALEVGMEAS
ncbi:MAG TPA: ATP-binding protein, partial [Verrucomicrobiaceae bacterium]